MSLTIKNKRFIMTPRSILRLKISKIMMKDRPKSKVTCSSTEDTLLVQPLVHVTVMLKSPPASCGTRSADQREPVTIASVVNDVPAVLLVMATTTLALDTCREGELWRTAKADKSSSCPYTCVAHCILLICIVMVARPQIHSPSSSLLFAGP